MGLRRQVSRDIKERNAADQQLAAGYDDKLAAATEAERALRRAAAELRAEAERRTLAVELDKAFTEALLAAAAAERLAMGIETYSPADGNPDEVRRAQIACRKAKAKATVRPWTGEVDRLRTARETNRLSFRPGPAAEAPA